MTYVTRGKFDVGEFPSIRTQGAPLLQLPGLRAAEFSSEPAPSKSTFTFEKVLKQTPSFERLRYEREQFQTKLVPPLGMQKAEYWMNLTNGWGTSTTMSSSSTSSPSKSKISGTAAGAGGTSAGTTGVPGGKSTGSDSTSTSKTTKRFGSSSTSNSTSHPAFSQTMIGLRPPMGLDILSGVNSVTNSRQNSKTRPGQPSSNAVDFHLKPVN